MTYKFIFTETKDILNSNMNSWLRDKNFIDITNNKIINFNDEQKYFIFSKDLNGYYKVFIWQIFYHKNKYIQNNIKLSDDIYMNNYLTADYNKISNKIISNLTIIKKGIIVLNPDE